MDINNIRISNIPRESLVDLWMNISDKEFEQLIYRSNKKELSLLFGHMQEKGISQTIQKMPQAAIIKIFDYLPPKQISKLILLSSPMTISKIILNLDQNLLLKTIRHANKDVRNKILKTLPEDKRSMLLELSEEEELLSNEYKYYLSEKFENSLEEDSLNRIKELEERERYLDSRQRAREEQYSIQLEHLRQQIAESEKELHLRKNKYTNIENNFLKKEQEFKDKIRKIQEEHQKQVQDKIEIKVPEFVKSAISVLEKKEKDFADKSQTWNDHGSIALGIATVSALVALIYGSFEFNSAAKENIDWFFFSFLLVKGLIIVSLFGAFAKHAYTVGNAYMHESLKRSDRMHAINFGKLYLEVYGNDVSQNDMKSIFENWNLDSDSAFTKVKVSNFEPKIVEQVTQMIQAVTAINNKSNSTINNTSKEVKSS